MSQENHRPPLTFSSKKRSTKMQPHFVDALAAIEANDPSALRDALASLKTEVGEEEFSKDFLMASVGSWQYTQEINIEGGDAPYHLEVVLEPNLKGYTKILSLNAEIIQIIEEYGCTESLFWLKERISNEKGEWRSHQRMIPSKEIDSLDFFLKERQPSPFVKKYFAPYQMGEVPSSNPHEKPKREKKNPTVPQRQRHIRKAVNWFLRKHALPPALPKEEDSSPLEDKDALMMALLEELFPGTPTEVLQSVISEEEEQGKRPLVH
ncbi:MAG: hypothetical protein V1746_06295 [bacterium]